MTHVILGHCCKDASCVRVCPQNCIHPAPGEEGFAEAETLYIDPTACIDCTACVEACPAQAIKPDHALTVEERPYATRNEEFYADANAPASVPGRRHYGFDRPLVSKSGQLRIAVVGSGPAAMYTVRELLQRSTSVQVTVFERYDAIGGLLQRGVSRDHLGVREMIRMFDLPFQDDRVTVVPNTEVGVDVTVDELRSRFDAVILACGAAEPRRPGAGQELDAQSGLYQAIDILVAENSGATAGFRPESPLGPTCLMVGAGNVAFDVVRWIAKRHTLVPSVSEIREIVVLSRSAPERAAFTPSAFYELLDLDSAELMIDGDGSAVSTQSLVGGTALLRDIARLPVAKIGDPAAGDKLRIILSFGQEVADLGRSESGAIEVRTTGGRTFQAEAAVCAAGFTTPPIDGVPLDERGVVPNDRGQVLSREAGEPVPGLYVVGWAKRGATGGVGDNRYCATETVARLADALAEV